MERRTVEDCIERMRAAESQGQRALARYWHCEARRANRLELVLVPGRRERRAWRPGVAEVTGLAAILAPTDG